MKSKAFTILGSIAILIYSIVTISCGGGGTAKMMQSPTTDTDTRVEQSASADVPNGREKANGLGITGVATHPTPVRPVRLNLPDGESPTGLGDLLALVLEDDFNSPRSLKSVSSVPDQKTGIETYGRSRPGTWEEIGNSLNIYSGSDKLGDPLLMAYGMYKFEGHSADAIENVTVDLAVPPGSETRAYIVSYSDPPTWQALDTLKTPGTHEIPLAGLFVSPNGNIYIVLAVYNLHDSTIHTVELDGFGTPPPPTGLIATDGEFEDRVDVTWTAAPGATSYKVFRATSEEGIYTQIGSPPASPYSDLTATPGTTYWYKTKSNNSYGDSTNFSNSDDGWRNLSAPMGLSATDGEFEEKTVVAWTASTGATGYKLYRATEATGVYELIGTSPDVTYDDITGEIETHYWYKATASCLNGDSGFSNNDVGWREIQLPLAPTNLEATNGTDTAHVQITWTASTGATGYKVFRSTEESGTYTVIGTPEDSPFDDATATPGITYWYKAKATNSNGDSVDFSNIDYGWRKLTAPTNVVATDGTFEDYVQITWEVVSGATGYKVFRSTEESGTYTVIGTPSETTFDDTTAEIGTPYWYKVKASCTNGDSEFSLANEGWRPIVVPVTPTGLVATDGDFTAYVQITWDATEEATGYKLYRATTENGTYTQISTPTDPNYDDTGATQGTSYWYMVKANNSAGDSDNYSNKDEGWRSLSAPTGLSATDGTSTEHVRVTWDSSTGATSYKVYRADSADETYNEIDTSDTTSFDDTTATPDVHYWYKAKASCNVGDSDYSNNDEGWRAVTPPDAPTGLSATDGTDTDYVQITWDASTGATGYRVYKATSESGTYNQIGTPSETSFDDTDATPGTTYWYKAKATNSGGDSPYSENDDGWRDLSAPTGLTASDGTSTEHVQVTWTASTGATGYKLYRGDSENGTYTQIGTPSETTFNDTTATPLTHYWYKAKAACDNGDSDYSNNDEGHMGLDPPAAPTGLVATDGTYTEHVRITWTASTGADSYKVYRATSSGGTYTQIGTPSGTSYNDEDAPADGSHRWYKAKATNEAGDSEDFSNIDEGWRGILPPAAPTGLTATDGQYTGYVRITWTASTGASSYKVYRANTSGGSYTQIGTPNGTSYDDTSAEPGTTYWYKAKGSNSAGDSENYSNNDDGWRKLSPPTNVTASNGTSTDFVVITWTASTGASSYKLYRATSSGGSYTQFDTAEASPYYDTNAAPGDHYWYKVKASCALGDSDYSSPADEGWVGVTPPQPPANVQASDGTYTGYVRVTWNASSGADGYKVYRAPSSGGSWTLLDSPTGTSYNDTEATPGTTYWYAVKASNSGGDSDYSDTDTGWRKLSAPTGVTASDGTSSSHVAVSWTASTGASSYKVYRATSSSGSYTQIGTDGASPYNDTTAPENGDHRWYKIRASCTNGDSSYSSADEGWRDVDPPPPPTGVTATDGTHTGYVRVTWSASTGATSYKVYRATSSGGSYTQIGTEDASPYDDSSATPGTTYWYKVKASNSGGDSNYSGNNSGWRKLTAPTGVAASDGTSTAHVAVSWSSVTGASSYKVYRATSSTGTYTLKYSPTGTSWNDTSATPGVSYYYKVKAHCTNGDSDYSSNNSGWRKLSAPTSVAASDGTSTAHVAVTWSASTGATGYKVYRATSSGGTYTLKDSPSGTSWNDDTATPGTSYWYKVKASCTNGDSDYSTNNSGWRMLSAPTSVQASDGTYEDYVQVTWTASTGANSYKVYRADTENGTYAQIGTPNGTTYNDEEAPANGDIRWYKVKASCTNGDSEYGGPDDGYRGTVPDPPENVQATDGTHTGYVQITWDASTGADGYKVYRSPSSNGDYGSPIGTPSTSPFDDEDATPGITYWYKVTASNDSGDSEYSENDDGWRKLSAPTNLVASDGTSTSHVAVSWTASTGASSYKVYRATSSGGTYTLKYSPTGTSWNDTSATYGVSYYYKVKANCTNGDSEYSENDDGWRKLLPPTGVAASDGTSTAHVAVSWSSVTGASSYKVYRATSSNGSYTLKYSPTGTSWNDTSATPGVSYYYKVKAHCTNGDSDYSSNNSGWRKLSPPTNVQASDGTSTAHVAVTWSSSPGASSYKVYRATSSGGSYTLKYSPSGTSWNDTSATPGTTYWYKVKAHCTNGDSDYSSNNSGWRKLSPPTNVQASDGTYEDYVRVTWSSSTGASSYKVYRANSSNGSYTLKYSPSGTSWNDTSVTPGTDYWYKVKAHCTNGDSDYSSPPNKGWAEVTYDPDNYEVDDVRSQANYFHMKKAVRSQSRTFHDSGDTDWMYVQANYGSTLIFESTGSMDTYAQLSLANGTVVASNDQGGAGDNFRISYTVTRSNEEYYLRVTEYYGDTGSYTLKFNRGSDIFNDPVNSSSGSHWYTADHGSGSGQFYLVGSSYFRHFENGQNAYDNNDDNDLYTRSLYVPPNTGTLKLNFEEVYDTNSGDMCTVLVDSGSGSFSTIESYSGDGSNGYNTTYTIPSNNSSSGKWYRIKFNFDSNPLLTNWGWEIDDVRVYEL